MPAVYPATLPVRPAAGVNLSTNPHSSLHNNSYDEIVAIATELGTSPKGTSASVKARLDALPAGRISYASATANQGGITAITDLTSLTATWTATAARLYAIGVCGNFLSSVANDVCGLHISTGAGVQVQSGQFYLPSSGVTSVWGSTVVILTGLVGAVTYKARLSRISGTGTLQLSASPTAPAQFSVIDMGLA